MRDGLARAVARRVPLSERDTHTVAALVAHGAAVLARRAPGELLVEVTPHEDGTRVDTAVEDVPLLLSTVTSTLGRRGLDPVRVLHPVLGVRRSEAGQLVAIEPARPAQTRESWIHAHLDAALDREAREALADELRDALDAARLVAGDYQEMRLRLEELEDDLRHMSGTQLRESPRELARLIGWLLNDRLVLLGVGEIDADGTHDDEGSLGLLRRGDVPALLVPPRDDSLLRVGRSAAKSPVHRRDRMVEIRVRGSDGRERRILGLFAAEAHADPVTEVPVGRRRLQAILDAEDLVEGSHDERVLRQLFGSLPLHEQLGADPEDLRRTLVPLLAAEERADVTLRYLLSDPEREAALLVTMPRDRFSSRVRERIQSMLRRRLDAAEIDYHLSMTRDEGVLLHFVARPPPGGPLVAPRADLLRREILDLTRSWEDGVGDALAERHEPGEVSRLKEAWLGRMPVSYRDRAGPAEAVADVEELDALDRSGEQMAMRLVATSEGSLRAKLYRRGPGVELSTLLPVLESLGLVVVDEVPHDLPNFGQLHDVLLRVPDDFPPPSDLRRRGPAAAATAIAVLQGRAEADDLNRLVLLSDLGWDDVAVLRAYRRYRRQLGTGFTEAYQNAALCEHPHVAGALLDLFAARLNPRLADQPEAIADARATTVAALEDVTRLDQDRILRGYLGLVDATLRTSRYIEPSPPTLALKLDSAAVPDVRPPVPHVETFVYAPELEGIHLRGGRVARGGLRHSDRREDVRAEVLGLMKAQMTKNAMIVPVGAKGGFVLKRWATDRDASVRRAYEAFVSALLDVTDNVQSGVAVPPPDVRPTDGEDSYLVVAPDRGTGRFSDLANAIALSRDYWLGDAFASGGSRGYDHKAMGITARGAWVAVRRHFAELGIDVDVDPFTVVGIGDMSGDVFGNAMRQSRAIRLVAAFDHRDVFLDPDPDPERTADERERLAALPRSSWQDFDRKLLSPGGGVWSRDQKSIPLSAEARTLLRTGAEQLSPPEVIRLILGAPADLLFAGGIGTYVKANDETHEDAADRANDGVRIDASALSARVIGEGANLALTQRARIHYSRRGGRCNTDAIDNAAGVATSDSEVNLKILLADAIAQGRLASDERDALLVAAEPEVATRVLEDCDAQTHALTRELARSPGGLDAYEELMADLERRGRLHRDVEDLPDAEELDRRGRAGAGLTRPELAQLLAYAKLDLRDGILESTLPEDPGVRPLLMAYLPSAIRERFADIAEGHRLRRELISTRLAGTVVDDMGITWARRVADELGSTLATTAAAYRVAHQVLQAGRWWDDIAALGTEVELRTQLELDATVRAAVDACARSYARRDGLEVEAAIAADAPVVGSVWTALRGSEASALRGTVTRWVGEGVPADLAERVAGLEAIEALPDVASLARERGHAADDVARGFAAASAVLPIRPLERLLDRADPTGRWARWQREGLADELRRTRREAVAAALAADGARDAVEAVKQWLEATSHRWGRVESLVADLESADEQDLDGVAVAARVLRDGVS